MCVGRPVRLYCYCAVRVTTPRPAMLADQNNSTHGHIHASPRNHGSAYNNRGGGGGERDDGGLGTVIHHQCRFLPLPHQEESGANAITGALG